MLQAPESDPSSSPLQMALGVRAPQEPAPGPAGQAVVAECLVFSLRLSSLYMLLLLNFHLFMY